VRVTEADDADEKPDVLRPIMASRSFFMLPQAPMECGYYTYGTLNKKPDRGRLPVRPTDHDDGDPSRSPRVAAFDNRRFGVRKYQLRRRVRRRRTQKPHRRAFCGCASSLKRRLTSAGDVILKQYDQAATAKLIELFRTFAPAVVVYFNDSGSVRQASVRSR
jgi:penicillin-insensitive murein endopeptidase